MWLKDATRVDIIVSYLPQALIRAQCRTRLLQS